MLADSFNRMLDRLAEAFSSQREFVADASHELRTPLTVIRGQLEVLAAQQDPSEEEVHRVERLVQAEIARLSRMVDDLLLLTQADRVDFLRPERIDVHQFVDELWDGLSLTAERRFELGAGARRHAQRRSRPARAGGPQPRAQRDRAHRRAGRPRAARSRHGRPPTGSGSR